MIRALGLLVACLALSACGLFTSDEFDFRSYPLEGVAYDDAVIIVRSAVRRYYEARFSQRGGWTLDWDADQGNLKASPIYDGERRMTLYLSLDEGAGGTNVEMMALVQELDRSGGQLEWTRPRQDVMFEQQIYDAILDEYLARRRGGP